MQIHNIISRAVHVDTRSEFPNTREPSRYGWQCPITGHTRVTVLKLTERQIVRQLMRAPIYCASRINLSAYVDKLRQRGLPIVTHRFRDPETAGSYGIYALSEAVVELGCGAPSQMQPQARPVLPPLPLSSVPHHSEHHCHV